MNAQTVQEKLEKLLKKLSLPKPITADDIKDIIWNAVNSSGSSKLFFLITEHETNQETIDETMRLLQDAWNYFPHRMLGGKSPNDLVLEYQQTGKVDKATQKPLPKKGKTLGDIFEDQYPQFVRFTKLGQDTWGFEFPKLYNDLTEQLWELEESKVPAEVFEKELYRMIKLVPELFDAVNDLAHMYGKRHEIATTKAIYEQAIKNARKYIPDTFIYGHDRMIWTYMENRPFLRLLAGHAMFVEQYEGTGKAIPFYEEILAFNPNDNQGIRALLATAYLKTNQPEKVVELASHYPGDSMPDLVMGALLGLFKLGRIQEAKKFLQDNKEYQKHVITELLKSSHLKPATLMKDRIRVGGEDEAYYYWKSQGKFWQKTSGALEFLAKQTEDIETQIVLMTDNDVLAVDFFHDFLTFLTRLKERPIKKTAAGNLSLTDIDALLQQLKTVKPMLQHFKEMKWKLRMEDEIQTLHMINVLADIMRLTHKRGNKVLLTKNGHDFLTKLSPLQQYTQLVPHYWYRVNWPHFSASGWVRENKIKLCEVLQKNQATIWQMLLQKDTQWIDFQSFCRSLRERLNLEPFLQEMDSKPEDILSGYVQNILFDNNLLLFGCVEIETKESNITRFRSTKVGLALYPRR